MGFFSRFERKVENTFESTANKMLNAPISPVQIAKKAEKQMRHEKMVGAGKQYAPTLYTVLVNEEDDERLLGYYPTLAGEIETYLVGKAQEEGLVMDGQPLVRFIGDPELRKGKFDVIAEPVAAPIVSQLRQEEMQRYGLAGSPVRQPQAAPAPTPRPQPTPVPTPAPRPMPAAEQNAYPEASDNLAGIDTFVGAETPGATPQTVPETIVFAAGEGNAAPTPETSVVRARLVNMTENRTYDLATARILLGRDNKSTVVVDDINASRTHAELRFEPQGAWSITDLGSTNGTFVNGREITSQFLNEGDQITIGMTTYVFSFA